MLTGNDEWVIRRFRAQLDALPEAEEPARGHRRQIGPGIWAVRTKRWLHAAVLDRNADLPLSTLQVTAQLIPPPPEWHGRAVCQGHDWSEFFGDDYAVRQPTLRPAVVKETRKLCAACPVDRDCLTAALRKRESHGIWAGTSGRQRRPVFDALDLVPP